MARTAPVPNIPAPPGMNPGTWIMGGGGAGGGGGPGSGNGKNGAGGAGGPNDGNGAKGNGNGAGSCGRGGAGACTNCSKKTSAGDPIDVVTGEVFTGWKTDLFLPAFINLDFRRMYSTFQRARDVGFGPGWVHGLAWDLTTTSHGLLLWTGQGKRFELPAIAEAGTGLRGGGWDIFRTTDGYLLRAGDEFVHRFVADEADPEIFRLVEVRYRQRGSIGLAYERGRLATITDAAGRVIVLDRDADAHIVALRVTPPGEPSVVFARYAYDDAGNLVAVADADGFVTRYAYDDAHRLVRLVHPTDLSYHFRYDERGRGVETWGDYGGAADPALADDVPAFLADGETPARGVLHVRLTFFEDGTSEVTDSLRFHRYFGSAEHDGSIDKAVDTRGGVTVRTLDDRGNEIAREDPLGAVWTWAYDEGGDIVRETDPEGRTVQVQRDDEGRVLSITDPAGGTIAFGRDANGDERWIRDQRGHMVQYERDARGMPIALHDRRGATERLRLDAHGNVSELQDAMGAITRYAHDFFGRRWSETDALGQTQTFRHSLGGKLLRQTDALGQTASWTYDGLGRVVSTTNAAGLTTRLERGGDGWITRLVHANGEAEERRYNREGWLVLAINEKGERCTRSYDADGMQIEEIGFDGRRHTYQRDARGHLVGSADVDRGPTTIARDRTGQIVAETGPSGAAWTYTYDARAELVAARGPDADVSYLRDAAGSVISETFVFDGATYAVDSVHDGEGARVAYRTSLGHAADLRRDASGRLTEIWADGAPVLHVERDAVGAPVRHILGQGGIVVDQWDAVGRLVASHVEPSVGGGGPLPGGSQDDAPAWVGGGGWDVAYRWLYSGRGEIGTVESVREGVVEYAYDLRRHLLQKSQNGTPVEAFHVDAAENYFPALPTDASRELTVGNRLVRHGDTHYVFDAAGFLREKRKPGSAPTRFTWDDWGLLQAVELPDGTRVTFAYDDTARRLRKTVVPPSGPELGTTTHYVWDDQQIRHAVTYRPGAPRRVRTYLPPADGDFSPQGHRDDDGPWIYYVRQPNGLPHDLVDGHGRLVGGGTFSSFGLALAHVGETTDVRALGQLADEETGLFYNRYRYYDPTLGRFISHDPIGMDGGSNTYAYGPNPVGWVDPLGLHRINVEGAPQGLNGTYESRDRGGKAENGKGGAGTVDCSERQLIEALRGEPKGSMKGSTIKVTGGLPPCPGCHAAMQKFASEEGSPTITYEWEDQRGGKNKITYPVGPGGGSVEGPITKSKDENDKKFVKQYSSGGDVGLSGYKSAAANASTPAGPPAGAPPTRGPGVPPPPPPEDKGKSGKKKKK